MRVLVTGGTGFVGRRLTQLLWQRGHVAAYTVHKKNPVFESGPYFSVDVTHLGDVYDAIETFAPDTVVHTAALTDADECENSPELAFKVNVVGTQNVVKACEHYGCYIAFVSSSFVFSGENNPYQEEDSRHPVNVYGHTKVRGENAVESADVRSLIVRTDQPYGLPQLWQPPTMITWLLEQLTDSSSNSASVFTDWYNNPILIEDLCQYITILLERGATGIYHVVGSEFISRYEWACNIAAALGYSQGSINPTTSKDADLPAKRPNAELINRKVVDEVGCSPTCIDSGLEMLATSFSS